MEQPVDIVDKQRIKIKAIFDSNLLTSRSTSSFKGYQETFPDLVASLNVAASTVPPYIPINLDPDIPAVIHIWHEIKCIIFNVNQSMKTFLNIFGVEERNGLSQFSVDIDSTYDLINLIKNIFLPPNRDLQENPKMRMM